jgi:hypothetical protein
MRKIILTEVFLTGITTIWLGAAEPALAVGSCNTVPCPVAYVSRDGYTIAGNGANACVLGGSNGCSLISEAVASVTTGGTVVIMDSGAYVQSVTVNKSVTITSEFRPTIAPPSGNPAFVVNTAGAVFELNGVILDGGSGGTFGVSATNAAEVRVKNTLIKNFTGGAVPSAINIKPAAGVTTKLTVDRTHAHNNAFGIVADGNSGGIVRGTVTNSIASNNSSNGISVSTSGASVVLLVDQTVVSGNNFGLVAGGSNGGMLVGTTNVVSNATGLFTLSSGVLYSYGNNTVNGNTTADGTFTSVISLK